MLRGWTAVNDDQDTTGSEQAGDATAPSAPVKPGIPLDNAEKASDASCSTGKETNRPGGEKTARDIGESLEVQEAQANKLYSDALGLLRSHGPGSTEWEQGKALFEQVLSMRIVETCTLQDQYSMVPRIKYCCLRNLASMLDSEEEQTEALRLYFDALDIDDTDISVWLAASKAAKKIGESRIEQVTLENVLLHDPHYLPAINRLLELAFVAGNGPLFSRIAEAGKTLHDSPVVQATLLQRALQINKEADAFKWPARLTKAFPRGQLEGAQELVLERSKRMLQAGDTEALQQEEEGADHHRITLELSCLKFDFVLRKVLALCRNQAVGHRKISLTLTRVQAEPCNGDAMEVEHNISQNIEPTTSRTSPKRNASDDVVTKSKPGKPRKTNDTSTSVSAQESARIHNKNASRFVSSALVGMVDPNFTLATVELLSREPEKCIASSSQRAHPEEEQNGKSQQDMASIAPQPQPLGVPRTELTLDELEQNNGKVDLLESLLVLGRAFEVDTECRKLYTRAVRWLSTNTQGRLFGKPGSTGLVSHEDWEGLLYTAEVVIDHAATLSEKVRKDLWQLCSLLMRRLALFESMLLSHDSPSNNSDQESLRARAYWLMYKFTVAFNIQPNCERIASLLHQCRCALAKASQTVISLPHCNDGPCIDAETLDERIGGLQARTTLDSLRSALSKEPRDDESLTQMLRKLEGRYIIESNGAWSLRETWKEFAGFPSSGASLELDWLKQQENISPFIAFHILSLTLENHHGFVVLSFLLLQALCEKSLITPDAEKQLALFVQVSSRVAYTLAKAKSEPISLVTPLLKAEQFIKTGFEVAAHLGDAKSALCLEATSAIAQYFKRASSFQRDLAVNLSKSVTRLSSTLDAKCIKARSGLALDVVKHSHLIAAILHVWVELCEATSTEDLPLGGLTLNTMLNPLLRLVYMVNFAISKNAGKEPTWTKTLCGNAMVVAAWLVLKYDCKPYKAYGRLVCTLRIALESQCAKRDAIENVARLATAELCKQEVILWVNQQQDRELSEDLETFRQEAMNQSYYCLYGLQDAAGGCRLWEYKSISCDPRYPTTKDEVNAYFAYLLPYLEGVTAYSSGFEHHEYIVELLRNMLELLKDEGAGGQFSRTVHDQNEVVEIFDMDENFLTVIKASRDQLLTQHPKTASSAETLSRIHFIFAEAMSGMKSVKPKSRKRGSSQNEEPVTPNYEPLIKFYRTDLTYNPWRIQSWFQLGLHVRDQALSDQTSAQLTVNIIANWASSQNKSSPGGGIPESAALFRKLKLCLRCWFIVTHLVQQDASASTSQESLDELRRSSVLPLFTRVFCTIRAYQETDVPANATITRVNENGTYDLTNEDDPGMEFHVNREWLEVREPWSQLSDQNANKFLGECYEIIGNTIYSNLFLLKHQDDKYKRILEQAKGCFEKFETIHPKDTHVATFMKARIMRKMGAPVQVYLPLLVASFKRLEAIGKKDGLGSGKLCREKVLYQIHSSVTKILLANEEVPIPDDTLAFLETVMFEQLKPQKQMTTTAVARRLLSDCVLKVCEVDKQERVMNLLLSSLAQLEEISTWNYQAVYRRGWIIWQASIQFPTANGSFNSQEALRVLFELVKKRPKTKGVNLVWNSKYVDFTEHIVRPAHRYHLVRFKVVRTLMHVCEAAHDFEKAQDVVEVLQSQPGDASSTMLIAECLQSAIRIVRAATDGESGSVEKWLDRAFKLYILAAQLTEQGSTEEESTSKAVVDMATQALVDLYTRHKGTTTSPADLQATLRLAINFCDRSSPGVRGKKKLSKAKLRLKKKRKTEESPGPVRNLEEE